MDTYHKIQTIWLRDPATNHRTLLREEWSKPEFRWLADASWLCEEKIDGMNVRVIWDGESVEFRGKTDAAQMPPHLLETLSGLFPVDKCREIFGGPITLYGEGFGAKIQKGGGDYSDRAEFCLFDAHAGVWLEREAVRQLGDRIGCHQPSWHILSLHEAVKVVRSGFSSAIGRAKAEGLICRPPVELTNRRGERVITKIKTRDFA